eukprot:m.126339 g.126339  ORF g.126339 m.126339 type:complete len:729 (-) comp16676_c0_seq6:109-2295(-)
MEVVSLLVIRDTEQLSTPLRPVPKVSVTSGDDNGDGEGDNSVLAAPPLQSPAARAVEFYRSVLGAHLFAPPLYREMDGGSRSGNVNETDTDMPPDVGEQSSLTKMRKIWHAELTLGNVPFIVRDHFPDIDGDSPASSVLYLRGFDEADIQQMLTRFQIAGCVAEAVELPAPCVSVVKDPFGVVWTLAVQVIAAPTRGAVLNLSQDTEPSECAKCGKPVYPLERHAADGKVFHKACVRCARCGAVLALGSYGSLHGEMLCPKHMREAGRPRSPRTTGARSPCATAEGSFFGEMPDEPPKLASLNERARRFQVNASKTFEQKRMEEKLEFQLANRPERSDLQKQNILPQKLDTNPVMASKRERMNRVLIERNLNAALSQKYGGLTFQKRVFKEASPLLLAMQGQHAAELPASATAVTGSDTPAALGQRRLSGFSYEHKSRFIANLEEQDKFVCHECCSEDWQGSSLSHYKYTFSKFFNEDDWKELQLSEPFHNEAAKAAHKCNVCFGVCCCGKEFVTDEPCSNCGSLPPAADGPRRAPEFTRPVVREDLLNRRANQLTDKARRIDELHVVDAMELAAAAAEPAGDEPAKPRQRVKFASSNGEVAAEDDLPPPKVQVHDFERYRFCNMFDEEVIFDVSEDPSRPIFVTEDGGFVRTQVLDDDMLLFTNKQGQTFALSKCQFGEGAEEGFPSNKAGIYMQDGKNDQLFYYIDKKIGEYFAWFKDSGQVVQAS